MSYPTGYWDPDHPNFCPSAPARDELRAHIRLAQEIQDTIIAAEVPLTITEVYFGWPGFCIWDGVLDSGILELDMGRFLVKVPGMTPRRDVRIQFCIQCGRNVAWRLGRPLVHIGRCEPPPDHS